MTRVLEMSADHIDLLALHAANPERYPYLLESRGLDERRDGWDILFAFPQERIDAVEGNFLPRLERAWGSEQIGDDDHHTIPFRGGWFLYLDYELVYEIEPVLTRSLDTVPSSGSFATRIPAALMIDHQNQRLLLVDEGTGHIEVMRADLDHCIPVEQQEVGIGSVMEESAKDFLNGVERIKQYIVEGDVFQVNLSRQWQMELTAVPKPYQIYQRLRQANPSPFSGLAVDGEHAIISSSPERLVKVRDDIAETRPIAGTHPRDDNREEDQALSKRLLAHPKEQAEHIMLIDLERNDLGRVCIPGTVEVDELMVLESYAHVHHIVSNVRGELRVGVTPTQVIRALFPGGTITGCPKVRCMEIIQELESGPRGGYTGSFGYLNRDGDMDLNILIRTLMVDGSNVTLRAGAGIVHDSIPEREIEETRAKAKGMLRALGVEQ